jgi:hypothetical protein
MEPNTQTSSPSPEVIPQEEAPVYHTISGGPETLQQIQEEKAKEIVQSVPEIVPQPAQQVEVQTVSSNQTQQISSSFNSINLESIVPQEVPQGESGILKSLSVINILIWIFISLLILIGTMAFGVVGHITLFAILFLSLFSQYFTKKKNVEIDLKDSQQNHMDSRRDTRLIWSAYIILVAAMALLIFGGSSWTIFFIVYGILASFLLFVAIKNIRERESRTMLGHFFLFLLSPPLIGFGVCLLGISVASI